MDDTQVTDRHHQMCARALKTHDFVVANPPFSSKAWSNGLDPAHDPYGRFVYGIPPAKNGDYAFLLHLLASLKSSGKGAIIRPHGVLFRGNAEASIRKRLVRQGYIKGIIGLPANLFYGTGIPACVIVLDKESAAARTGIFMIDASRSFIKDGNKNRLRAQDIHRIVDTFTRQVEVAKYARLVPLAEIEANNDNLNIPRYIDSTEPEDLQDIEAHLRGGIPDRDIDALDRYWQVFPILKSTIFAPADRAGYSRPMVVAGEVKSVIFGHPEFAAFNRRVDSLFETWRRDNSPRLEGIERGDHPKALIKALSESLLDTFRAAPLLDAYDVYQHLMDYWAEAMQDDAYQIVLYGWQSVLDGKPNTDLIPFPLLVARYFAAEAAAIDAIEAERDAITRRMEEMAEEHGGEDGLLEDARTDKGKLTARSVKDRLKDIMADADSSEERAMLNDYLALIDGEATAGKRARDARKTLDAKVSARYTTLTEADIKTLVVDDKWLARLAADVQGEMDRVSQALTGRIKQLAERYATPLPSLADEVAELTCRVDAHLREMGFAWN